MKMEIRGPFLQILEPKYSNMKADFRFQKNSFFCSLADRLSGKRGGVVMSGPRV